VSPTQSSVADRPAREVWSVSRLNYESRALLDSAFGTVWVDGEISNFARPRSGHLYFTLKDSSCQVRCAMFRGANRHLQFEPGNGQQVLLRARVGLYAERGDYQLIVEHMEEAGEGALRRAFDALKARLAAEGLFDNSHKQAIPAMPQTIGVVTSATGAALRDVLATLGTRFPSAETIIYPVPVQGSTAAPAIEKMLALASSRAECDVLIVARGGGSLEDLWPFNEERTARAIFACKIPIVSGVGHEIDFTISDFVADARGATPTAAAQMVTPDARVLTDRVAALRARVARDMHLTLRSRAQQLTAARSRLVHPRLRLQDYAQRADHLSMRLQQAVSSTLGTARLRHLRAAGRLGQFRPEARIEGAKGVYAQLRTRLQRAIAAGMENAHSRHRAASRALATVGPQATLARGYAIIANPDDGSIIRDASSVAIDQPLHARLASGQLDLRVEAIRSDAEAE
jgi:exodeoxyribonuclease VII large subunit